MNGGPTSVAVVLRERDKLQAKVTDLELELAEATTEMEAQLTRTAEARAELVIERDQLKDRVAELEALVKDLRDQVAQAVTRDVRPVPSSGHQEAAQAKAHLRNLVETMAAIANGPDDGPMDQLQGELDVALSAGLLFLQGVPVEVTTDDEARLRDVEAVRDGLANRASKAEGRERGLLSTLHRLAQIAKQRIVGPWSVNSQVELEAAVNMAAHELASRGWGL